MSTVSITIQVPRSDYPSLQIGDTAFYASTSSSGGFNTTSSTDMEKIGKITNINNTTSLDDGTETTTLTCDIATTTPIPTTTDFIFFSKENKVNSTSLLGYYAKMKFKNDSTSKAEMFSVASEIIESSK
jgi:hypothetical protein